MRALASTGLAPWLTRKVAVVSLVSLVVAFLVAFLASGDLLFPARSGIVYVMAPDGNHVALMGGRIFECGVLARSECIEAALLAAIEEANTLRITAGKCACRDSNDISATGGYCVSAAQPETGGNMGLDLAISSALCAVAGQGASVLDLGCGLGHYQKSIEKCGLSWRGFDGSANIEAATGGRVHFSDLSVPIDVGVADWVLSLEVGEHVPKQYESTYLDNVVRHARHGVILSWAVPGQVGHYHVNCRENEEVIQDLKVRGFEFDAERTRSVRSHARFSWLQKTTMVFRRAPV